MDTEYSVLASLTLEDHLGPALDRNSQKALSLHGHLKELSRDAAAGLANVGGIVAGGFDATVKWGAAAATLGAGIAGAAGFAALKTGIVSVNSELEQTTLGLGTLFRMFGAADNVSDGFGMARDLVAQIREDAKSLPGEFQDFVGMAQTLTAPILNMGKGMQDIRDLTRDTVVAASSLGIRYDQASREMAMLLEGHAGGHNVLGTRLGITTSTQVNGKDFNQATALERFEFIAKKLGPAKESLDAFSMSWGGLTSTMVDAGKQFLGNATGPLFDRLRHGLADILGYLDRNKDTVKQWEIAISNGLVTAFDWVRDRVEDLPLYADRFARHWGAVSAQIKGAAHWLEQGFHRVMPLISKALHFMGKELEHPAKLMKELAAIRIGAGLAQQAPGILNMGFKAAEMFGGGGAAAGAEGAGAAAGGAAAAATGPLLIALASVAAVGVALFDNVQGSAEVGLRLWNDLSNSVMGVVGPLVEQGGLFRDVLGGVGAIFIRVIEDAAQPLIVGMQALGSVLTMLNTGWHQLTEALGLANTGFEKTEQHAERLGTVFDVLAVALASAINPLAGVVMLFQRMGLLSTSNLDWKPEDIIKQTEVPPWIAPQANYVQEKGVDSWKHQPAPTVDARGSKIEIKLDVRDTDPDRIVKQLFDALGKRVARPVRGGGGTPMVGF